MTNKNSLYEEDKIYPGLCSEFLSDMAKEMEGIMVDAINNDIQGIHDHLAIINNTVIEMLKIQSDQTENASKEKFLSEQKRISTLYKKSLV